MACDRDGWTRGCGWFAVDLGMATPRTIAASARGMGKHAVYMGLLRPSRLRGLASSWRRFRGFYERSRAGVDRNMPRGVSYTPQDAATVRT